MASFDDDYDVRTLSPVLDGSEPDAATAAWLGATRIGFHQSNSAIGVRDAAREASADGRVFTGVYARTPLAGSLDPAWPVATYADYVKTINVGGGALVDSFLISDVTVRPTHRRKGILRHMMEARLAAAASQGLALAALTASESTIYRRFGFGPATRQRGVRIKRHRPFALHIQPQGRVELASAQELGDVIERVFAAFHAQTPGSVDRQAGYRERLVGLTSNEGKLDESLRAAVHYGVGAGGADAASAAGAGAAGAAGSLVSVDDIDGYVIYKMTSEGGVDTLEVVDLIGTTRDAVLGLWDFVGSVDLVDAVVFRHAPEENPLLHALVDSRSLQTERDFDHVWIRILDVAAALSARPYAADGTLTLRVHDALGYTSGVFQLHAADGRGEVTRLADDAHADLSLDTATLASLYLGGVAAALLVEAGLVVEHTPGSAALASGLFAPDRPVHSATDF
jgi:predicted acetyltransferase